MTSEEITKLRLDKGLTQAELANLLPCSLPTINRYEHGKTKPLGIYQRVLDKIRDGELDQAIEEIKQNRRSKKQSCQNVS